MTLVPHPPQNHQAPHPQNDETHHHHRRPSRRKVETEDPAYTQEPHDETEIYIH
jgi:hypothetical protein